jgi:hypothetical protein
MNFLEKSGPIAGLRLGMVLALVTGLAALGLAQQPGGGKPATSPHVRTEYVHQEVQADAVVQSLNDLDGQGWEVFQVVPTWQIKNENGEGALVPKSYQVFGRRPVRDAK